MQPQLAPTLGGAMPPGLRFRFWLESVLSAISSILAIVTFSMTGSRPSSGRGLPLDGGLAVTGFQAEQPASLRCEYHPASLRRAPSRETRVPPTSPKSLVVKFFAPRRQIGRAS